MLVAEPVRALPGPKSFYGIKNIRDMGQKGILDFIEENWRNYGDIFEVAVGPQKLVIVIHPDHVRHVTLTNAPNYDKLKSYEPVRKYIPFASGQRVCLGNHFSLLETHIMLALLARRFDPQLPPGYEAEFVGNTLLEISNGLPMILEKRQ